MVLLGRDRCIPHLIICTDYKSPWPFWLDIFPTVAD